MLASVKRAGGCVSWPFGCTSRVSSWSPSASGGNRRSRSSSSASGSSAPSTYARRKPGEVMTLPDAASVSSSPAVVVARNRTDALVPVASIIWLATVRCQISS